VSGENHEGNKSSPDIYDGKGQRRFLCSQAMKHEAMKAYETQGSSLEGSKEGRTPKCPRADKAVTGSSIRKRKGHMTVHWQIGLLLGATFERGKDTEMSIGMEAIMDVITPMAHGMVTV
jgi:hypothetical protein